MQKKSQFGDGPCSDEPLLKRHCNREALVTARRILTLTNDIKQKDCSRIKNNNELIRKSGFQATHMFFLSDLLRHITAANKTILLNFYLHNFQISQQSKTAGYGLE